MTGREAMSVKLGDVVAADLESGPLCGKVAATSASGVSIRWDNAKTGEPMSYALPYYFNELSDVRKATAEDKAARVLRKGIALNIGADKARRASR